MMSGSDSEPGLNPFANLQGKKKGDRGLYGHIPHLDDDDNDDDDDGFLEAGKAEKRKQIMLPGNSLKECRLFMMGIFFFATLAVLVFTVGPRNDVRAVPAPTNTDTDGTSSLSTLIPGQDNSAKKATPFYYSEVFDPFQLQSSASSNYAALFSPPSTATLFHGKGDQNNLGFLSQPSVFNNTLVFISEGDIYISSIHNKDDDSYVIPASRLTQTVGNVLTPKINPKYPYLIAFSATYTASRELYLMDLRQDYRRPAQRLTYIPNGIREVVSWSQDGKSILFTASNQNIALPSTKIYSIAINTSPTPESPTRHDRQTLSQQNMAGSMESLPLAQAVDAVPYGNCLYFIRYKQSSKTFRYLGGTAETLWGYCQNKDKAVKLYDYIGTTRSPQIYQQKYLLFISDRYYPNSKNTQTQTSTLNLFAVPLPTTKQMYNGKEFQAWSQIVPLALTSISCEEGSDGRQLMEYDIDQETGHIVLRVGADFKMLDAAQIQSALESSFSSVRRRLEDGDEGSTSNENNVDSSSSSQNDDENAVPKSNKEESTTPSKEKASKSSSLYSGVTNTLTSTPLRVAVYSDFNLQQERRFSVKLPKSLNSVDIFPTLQKQNYALLSVRGQAFVAPVLSKPTKPYTGMGQMLPPRSYKLMPSSDLGGITRVLNIKYLPSSNKLATPKALVLATDPLSETAEHAIYVLPCDSSTKPHFSVDDMPIPILGGHTSTGGSSKDGGLGSVDPESLQVSPCGRRAAWVDKEGRITVITIPTEEGEEVDKLVLPAENNKGEPIAGNSDVSWSPGGRYLAIEHGAKNQFTVVSIADLSDPAGEEKETNATIVGDEEDDVKSDSEPLEETPKLKLNGIYQVTPSRFNSGDVYWGHSRTTYSDIPDGETISSLPSDTLYFMTDRDVVSDVKSPWGTRAPLPHLKKDWVIYALPLPKKKTEESTEDESMIDIDFDSRLSSPYPNGGATELIPVQAAMFESALKVVELMEDLLASNETDGSEDSREEIPNPFQIFISTVTPDIDIDFENNDDMDDILYHDENAFARQAYRIGSIPPGKYVGILSQLSDSPSLLLLQKTGPAYTLKLFKMSAPDTFTQNGDYSPLDFPILNLGGGLSTTRDHWYLKLLDGVKVVENNIGGLLDLMDSIAAGGDDKKEGETSMIDQSNLIISIYPKLEYQQMFADAWRMMRDYFYDPNMHGVDWNDIFNRYQPLVARCAKREELDDILSQMGSEVSALHVFVYGGEYEDPTHGDKKMKAIHSVASLGATFARDVELGGYILNELYLSDPDFAAMDEKAIYSPLSNKVMRLSGQKGLKAGDAIVSINNENVMEVPDMHMLLRGTAGHSVRLDVLRKGSNFTESIVTVPISGSSAAGLRYAAWEYRTRVNAMKLAKDNGFTCGYIHLRDMDGSNSIDAFTRNFFPDYDKQALIIDVRHNNGGSIDSWLITELQRRAWSYFQGRATNVNNGGLGWNEQFAFRGHLVVLMNENTASDGEGFSRGVMELGLGKTVGVRTWGGGIWLSSDNHLVDNGILSAPEVGVYNDNTDWGMGIENMGVDPDIVVDNDPRQVELGNDQQLQKAIEVLKNWLEQEPIVLPKNPGPHPDTSLKFGTCK